LALVVIISIVKVKGGAGKTAAAVFQITVSAMHYSTVLADSDPGISLGVAC